MHHAKLLGASQELAIGEEEIPPGVLLGAVGPARGPADTCVLQVEVLDGAQVPELALNLRGNNGLEVRNIPVYVRRKNHHLVAPTRCLETCRAEQGCGSVP